MKTNDQLGIKHNKYLRTEWKRLYISTLGTMKTCHAQDMFSLFTWIKTINTIRHKETYTDISHLYGRRVRLTIWQPHLSVWTGRQSLLTFCQMSSNCSTPSATFFRHRSISPGREETRRRRRRVSGVWRRCSSWELKKKKEPRLRLGTIWYQFQSRALVSIPEAFKRCEQMQDDEKTH